MLGWGSSLSGALQVQSSINTPQYCTHRHIHAARARMALQEAASQPGGGMCQKKANCEMRASMISIRSMFMPSSSVIVGAVVIVIVSERPWYCRVSSNRS